MSPGFLLIIFLYYSKFPQPLNKMLLYYFAFQTLIMIYYNMPCQSSETDLSCAGSKLKYKGTGRFAFLLRTPQDWGFFFDRSRHDGWSGNSVRRSGRQIYNTHEKPKLIKQKSTRTYIQYRLCRVLQKPEGTLEMTEYSVTQVKCSHCVGRPTCVYHGTVYDISSCAAHESDDHCNCAVLNALRR